MTAGPSAQLGSVFSRLRDILRKHSGPLAVADDTAGRYCLDGAVGPATLQAWGGTVRTPRIPVAWVEIRKSYVSCHLMALGSEALRERMSAALSARLQGKTCLNFTSADEPLFKELEELTATAITAFVKAGFVAREP